ncbi:MAG: branched-chain amino acid ABC transporter permease [Betaproteobacteria bacterium]|nr:branched-chain amino acid ABC transporter permease [Betaproteobacteria bacterium]
MLEELAIIGIRGLGMGAIYALVAMSMNIVYGSSHILNFAQGNMFVLGGFVAVLATAAQGTPGPYAALIVLAVAWYVALRLFLTRTLTGLAISALSQDIEAASTAGLRVRRLQLLSFAVSGLVVGSAGFAAAPLMSISGDTGARYVLNGFVAAVIGGMGNNLGALVGGALVGIVGMLATYLVGGEYQGLVTLLLLVAMLVVRPEGIFGRARARRV